MACDDLLQSGGSERRWSTPMMQPKRIDLASSSLDRFCCLIGFVAWLFASPALAEEMGLLLIDSHKIQDESRGYSEPSGLSSSSMAGLFWSISDAEAKLHLLETDGSIHSSLRLPEALGYDLEGVAARPDGSLLLLQERDWNLVVVQPNGTRQATRYPLRQMRGFSSLAGVLNGNPKNKGPEGLTVDPETGVVFVAIEAQPRLLLEISSDLSEIRAATELKSEMGFQSPEAKDEDLDVSGLAWSQEMKTLWILSDTGRRVFVFDPSQNRARPLKLSYEVDGKTKTVKNAEGIALDEKNDRLFILNDNGKKSRLFVFRTN